MKKIIVTDTVREYAAMFAEKGEKATLKAWEKATIKAWEKAEKTTDYAETDAVALCLNALFARGDMTFIEAMFAEKDATKLFDPLYRLSFMPENYETMQGKQYKKWAKVLEVEHELASWWAFHNLPFLGDILDKFTEATLESREYLYEAEIMRDTFLEEVRANLRFQGNPSFTSVLIDNMVETLTNDFDMEDYGYDNEGYEADVWEVFCWDSYGLRYILENVYSDFVNEVAENMINYLV